MGDTVIVETPVDEVVSIVTAGPQGPSGSEAATLTTTGDLLYRAALANDRLPIGSEGQVLRVASGLPAWGNESGAVTSVNGETGTVVLDAADVGAATSAQGSLADSAVQPGDLATVATSGDYDDLTNKPTTFTPSTHAASHATGGADALTPANIGAAATAHTHQASDIVFGQFSNDRINWNSPNPIGSDVANSGTFTTLTANTALAVAGGIITGASNVLEMVNSTAAQTFNIYGSYALPNIFERLSIRAQFQNNFIIATERGTTGGAARGLEFQTDGVSRWTIATNGALSASSASRLNLKSLSFQHYGSNNALIGENCEYVGSWRYIASGAAGMFYFLGAEGQFRFFASGSALAGLPNGGNSTQFKVNADGTVALGGTGVYNAGVYTDNTLAVNATTATFKDATNIVVGTTTGTKIGTATTQKLGFFNATPVAQQAAVADATDAASTQDRLNDLLARLRTLGLIAT